MRGAAPRSRARPVSALRPAGPLLGLALSATLLIGTGAQAATTPDPQSAEVSESALTLASAAARGAGVEVTGVLADRAERAGVAVGGVAVTVRPAGKAQAAGVTGRGPTWAWNGWVSGASGPETLDDAFGTWRGEPVGLVGVWADQGADSQTNLSTLDAYSSYRGEMDVAVGALVRGETWQQAADGQFVTRWTTAARNLKAKRAGKGTTYVRIAHEMNGDWMAWGVNATTLAAYQKGYRLYATIIRKEFPQARLTWSPNASNHTNVSIDQLWPGDDIVDAIGPDLYDFDPTPTTAATWQQESSAWLTPQSPTGLDAWQKYAARRGKPLALPEWGLAAGDDPEWIRRVHGALTKYAARKGGGSAAGRVVYDCYFNAEEKFKLHNGPNPNAGLAYAALKWGN